LLPSKYDKKMSLLSGLEAEQGVDDKVGALWETPLRLVVISPSCRPAGPKAKTSVPVMPLFDAPNIL
jgi:hypothetical protein